MTTKETPTENKPRLARLEHASLPVSLFSTGDRRLDGENYLSGGFAIRLQIQQSGCEPTPLGRLARIWYPGRLKSTIVDRQHGVPYLTATQVFDIRPSARKWIAPGRFNPSEMLVQPDWILVTRSGSVGDVTLSGPPHLDSVISDDLIRIEVEDRQHLGYLYTFLKSRFGRTMMRSNRYGSIIKHLEPDHLLDMPIPSLDQDLSKGLGNRTEKVFALRVQAFSLTEKAHALFATSIGALPTETETESGYTVDAKQLFRSRRLDGYYYNPAAEAVINALEATGKDIFPLASQVDRIFGVPRFKHVYTDLGIPYLDSEDLFKINPELTKFIPEVTKRDADKYHVDSGWLLMACSGQLYGLNGSCIVSDTWHENKIVSNHVLRIVPKEKGVRVGYLQVALGHSVFGRPLVLRSAYGTSVPEITPEDLRSFPLIRLDPEIEDEIADCIESASNLRMQADHEEDAAVQLLEHHLEVLLRTHLDQPID